MRYFAKSRFNYIEVLAVIIATKLLASDHPGAAFAVLIGGGVMSVCAVAFARGGKRQDDEGGET